MAARLTEQQRLAVGHRGSSVVLASGAGCGKTHVLTHRYLSHLEHDHAEVSQVVAITFTERAAREMRGRIRAAVAEKLRAEPGGRWKRHLRNLEAAPVTTIHGFCGTLLRRHAAAADLDPHFEVLDDTLSATLRTEAVIDCLHRLLVDAGELGDDLRELVVLYGWAAVRAAVGDLLLDPDWPKWEEWTGHPSEAIAADWRTTHRRKVVGEFVRFRLAADPDLRAGRGFLAGVRPPTPDGEGHRVRVLAGLEALLQGDADADPAALADAAKVGTQHARLKKQWGEANYPSMKAAFDAIKSLCESLAELLGPAPLAEATAAVGQRVIRVALAADAAYRDRKRRAAALDFQDLLALTRDLLRDHPAARDDLRSRHPFVLLDELQDTDPVQMELVQLLCGAGLTDGRLFAVGDAKQSIYRFRGADVNLFRDLQSSMPAEGQQKLSRNYRSQPGVIGFVNALCGGWFPNEELEPHRPDLPGVGHHVEFLWATPPSGDDEAKPSKAAVRAAEAEAIASRIVELLADTTPRVGGRDGPRRVEPQDIVLLFRSMSHVATYEAALRRHGLDYYLVGGRAFFAQQEVYDLLNLLRAVENPQDGPAVVGVLRSPFCNLSDEAVYTIGTHPDGVWAGLLDESRTANIPAAARARRHLLAWRAAKDRLPIAGLLNRVFAESGYDAATQFEFLGDRKLANLWKLIDLAREFDRTGFGLADFVARLADLVSRQPREEQAATRPEEDRVIRLMSVHQAKGLEFPVVVVPDLAADARGDRYPVVRWHRTLGCLPRLPADVTDDDVENGDAPFDPYPDALGRAADAAADWDEGLRVLYVACTRPRDLLILSAGLPTADPSAARGPWLTALAGRYDPLTGRALSGDGPVAKVLSAECRVLSPETPTAAAPAPIVPILTLSTQHSALSTRIVSLPALERDPPRLAAEFPAGEWAGPRERLDALTPTEAAFWRAFAGWDVADPDGWAGPLADALADVPDAALAGRLADELPGLFRRFAASAARNALVGATEVRREVEFVLDLKAAATRTDALIDVGRDPLPVVRGLIDVLYRDDLGWHLLAVHLVERPGRSPWRDAAPFLAVKAWAMREALGEPVRTAGLVDLVAGEFVVEPAKKLREAAGFALVRDRIRAAIGGPPAYNKAG